MNQIKEKPESYREDIDYTNKILIHNSQSFMRLQEQKSEGFHFLPSWDGQEKTSKSWVYLKKKEEEEVFRV